MLNLTFNEFGKEDENTKSEILSLVNANFKNRINCAFEHSYHINDENAEQLQGLFPHRYVIQKRTGTLKESSHPILAILNEYSNYDASLNITRYRNKGYKVMTIGDSVDRKLKADHNCMLIENARDCYRVTSTNSSAGYKNYATGRKDRIIECVSGSQNCDFKAEIAIAVHSLYDVTPQQITDIFNRHNITQMIAYLHFPLYLYDTALEKHDIGGFNCVPLKGGKLLFAMKDFSSPYIHSFDNWKSWATLSKISNDVFEINIEHVRTHGPLHVLNLVRTKKTSDIMPIYVPLSTLTNSSYLVPNIYHAFKNNYNYRQWETQHFVVPNYFVEGVLDYANRTKDESYQFCEVCTYATGLRTQIVIGNRVYRKKWEVNQNEYKMIVLSLFIIGAISRTERTKIISASFAEMKHLNSMGFFGDIWHSFTAWLGRVLSAEKTVSANAMGEFVNNFKVVQFSDQFYTKEVYCTISDKRPITPLSDIELSNPLQDLDDFDKGKEDKNKSTKTSKHINNKNVMNNNIKSPLTVVQPSAPLMPVAASAPPLPNAVPLQQARWVDEGKGNEFDIETLDSDEESVADFDCYDDDAVACVNDIVDSVVNGKEVKVKIAQSMLQNNGKLISLTTLDNENLSFGDFTADELDKIVNKIKGNVQVNSSINSEYEPFVDPQSTATSKFCLHWYCEDGERCIWTPELEKALSIPESILKNVPRSFLSGHCALVAIWNCFPKNSRPKQKDILLKMYELLQFIVYQSKDVKGIITDKNIISYICEGDWDNDCSAIAIELLSRYYELNVNLHSGHGTKDYKVYKFYCGPNDAKINNLYFSGKHYYRAEDLHGGGVDKFEHLIPQIFSNDHANKNIIELSAAPGYLINKLLDYYENQDIEVKAHVGVYTGPGAAKWTQQKVGSVEHYADNFNYIFKDTKFSLIISDAGRGINSEALTKQAVKYCEKHLNVGGSVCIKTFGDPHEVYEFATYFYSASFVGGKEESTERYFIGHGYKTMKVKSEVNGKIEIKNKSVNTKFRTFEEVYDGFHRSYTKHVLQASSKHVDALCQSYFKGPFDRFKPTGKNKSDKLTVTCYTGFASSSKTTNLVKQYPKAVFIAPTKVLSLKHQKMGVRSFTPHTIFDAEISNDVPIIIDELSQFCVEYVFLLNRKFPDNEIVLTGDVNQTNFVNYSDKLKYTTFIEQGISNNIIDVYKIPKDITHGLNFRNDWHIRTHSEVDKSLYVIKNLNFDDLFKLRGGKFDKKTVKVICYNSATQKTLESKGYDASTITTYTGSRTENVILYVDAAAIESQYLNKPSVTYTALTRATTRMFLYGETESLVKYYNFSATIISTLEDFNKIYFHDETFVRDKVEIPLTQSVGLAKDNSVTLDMAESIVDQIVKPANPNFGNFRLATNCNIGEVKGAILVTNENAITNFPKDEKVVNVSKRICNVLNQLSDNSVQTIKTLVKRYGKKYKSNSKRDCQFTHSCLIKGMSKALYGNDHSVHKLKRDLKVEEKELLGNAYAYTESLSEKLGESYISFNELQEMFELDKDGQLKFFNKRQTKWKPEDGFDTSDKVGQGVAGFGKKVNILFSAYARTLLDKVKHILKENNRNILLATHNSEAGINDEFISLMQNTKETNFTCNDFSEWDSSFRKPFAMLTKTLCSYMGMPDYMNEWFYQNRGSWSMIYRNIFGKTTLFGTEKQFSGNPFTICENTIGNMALCFSIFVYLCMQFAMFKGDDSVVSCDKMEMLPEALKILKYTEHGLKLHNSPIGEFAGWFLTREGLFPDVIRYTSKFISKNYRDEKHFEEALQSLQERCSAVKSQSQLQSGCAIAAKYYSEMTRNQITPEQVNILFQFLKNSRNINFKDLEMVKKSLLIVEQ